MGVRSAIAQIRPGIKELGVPDKIKTREERLAEIRKKILITTNFRDLEKLRFELRELEKSSQADFELEELKTHVERGLEFAKPRSAPRDPRAYLRSIHVGETSNPRLFWTAIAIIVLIMFLSYFYWFA